MGLIERLVIYGVPRYNVDQAERSAVLARHAGTQAPSQGTVHTYVYTYLGRYVGKEGIDSVVGFVQYIGQTALAIVGYMYVCI